MPGGRSRFVPFLSFCSAAASFALVKGRHSEAFDLAMTLKLQRYEHPTIHRAMAAISWPGFPPQSRAIPALIAAGWLAGGRPRAARYQLVAWGPALIASAIKALVRRPRPLAPAVRVALAPLGGSSFPSGHVLTYVGVYGGLAYLLMAEFPPTAGRLIAVTALLSLVGAIGPSRVEQGHHWATDVMASYCIGLGYLWVAMSRYHPTATS